MPELAAMLVAASLGAMLFFSAVVAPTVFAAIPVEQAGAFLRAVFPRYFVINGLLALVAAALTPPSNIALPILVACGLPLLAIWLWAIPAINAARDAALAGDAAAGRRFDRLHRLTVVVNLLQMAGLLTAAALLLRPTT